MERCEDNEALAPHANGQPSAVPDACAWLAGCPTPALLVSGDGHVQWANTAAATAFPTLARPGPPAHITDLAANTESAAQLRALHPRARSPAPACGCGANMVQARTGC